MVKPHKNTVESQKTCNNSTGPTVRLSRIQKLIGERMSVSKAQKPCFYIGVKADVTQLMGRRHKLKKSLGIKITTNAFYIRALALAGKKYPLMVARLEGNRIRIAETINVGFAVNAPQGLVVPVVKNAQEKTLVQIAQAERTLTDKARSNSLLLEDIEGETIGLSNLGAYDIDSFIGIVPPPASTILAVGNVIHMSVPCNGKPVERKMVTLTLAADRRIIEEVYAAKFLNYIKEELENLQQLI